MLRLLAHHGQSAVLEEVVGQEHWWWDTKKDNDGGVLNDGTMRQFYAQCLTKHKQNKQTAGARCGQFNATRPLQLAVVNVAMHEGSCGVRILSQFKSMHISKLSAFCEGENFQTRTCRLSSGGNVKSLYIRVLPTTTTTIDENNPENLSQLPFLFGAVTLIVDNEIFPVDPTLSFVQLCWDSHKVPFDCSSSKGRGGGRGDGEKVSSGVPQLASAPPVPSVTGPIRSDFLPSVDASFILGVAT